MIRLSQEIIDATISTHYNEGREAAILFLKRLLELRGIFVLYQESQCIVKGMIDYSLEDRIGIQEGWYTFSLADPTKYVM